MLVRNFCSERGLIMTSSSRRGLEHSPRDARQLDLNFCFGQSRLISSEDGDSNIDNAIHYINFSNQRLRF